jgi:maltose-binding protein MalE
LQEHRPALYAQLSLTGKLVPHLNDVDAACAEQVERVVEDMAKAEGVTEALKEANQMEWVRRMNSIWNRAEEFVSQELIYTD